MIIQIIDDGDWMKLTSLVNRTENNRIDDLEENRQYTYASYLQKNNHVQGHNQGRSKVLIRLLNIK